MFKNPPKLIKFLITIVLLEVVLFTIFRIGFISAFNGYGENLNFNNILYSFWIGFRFDLQLAILINLPILIFGGIKYLGIFKSTFAKYFWLTYILITNIALISIYIIDFAYFDFFKKMVDSSIVRYFYDFGEAFRMISEDYPIYTIFIFSSICFIFIFLLLKKLFDKINIKEDLSVTRKAKTLTFTIFTIIFIFAGYGKAELYPWRWSEAFYSSNTFLSYLSSNPVTYFINTLKNKDIPYDKKATQKYYDTVANFLEIKDKDPKKLSLARTIVPNHTKELTFNKPNIVFILSESLAYCRTDMSENPMKATPFLNTLAKAGISYERYFTPHAGTARSVFTAMTGLSDVERMKTSSRNPMVVQQHMILNSLTDYKKFYFIGGSLSWGNVRGVIGNVDGIVTREEASYKSPRNDVWGISDIDLFREAHETLKTTKEPFFAFIQLAGNHSPFTIPNETYGFKKTKGLDKDNLMKYSFDGKIQDFNSQSFMDHSFEHFFNKAKKEKYFDNTIFIIVGDHGLPKQSKHMHKVQEKFTLNSIHTPLIIYAPKLIKHKKISYPISEVDMMATIAGLSNSKYINSTLGRDILDKDFDSKLHYAYFMTHENNPTINLIGEEFIYKVRSDGSNPRLYKYYFDKENENLLGKYPEIEKEMHNICKGIFESTRYTRFNNSSKQVQKYIELKKVK